MAPPPTGWSPSTAPTRRPWWRSKWAVAGLVVVAVLAVGFGTGNISFFLIRDAPTGSTFIPANNVPGVATVANGTARGTQLSFRYPSDWQVLSDPYFSTREHRAAIAKGCDQILRTFRIGPG